MSDMFQLKDSVKTYLKTILEDNIHLGLTSLTYHQQDFRYNYNSIQNQKCFCLLEKIYRGIIL